MAKKEWKWVEACSGFLLKAGDSETKRLLQRYASNQFTQEEFDLNKDSGITKEDMQAFAAQIVEQKWEV